MKRIITALLGSIVGIFLIAILQGCPTKLAPTLPKTSSITTSEVAEAVISGVVNATYTSGTMARYVPSSPKSVALGKLIEGYLNPLPRAEAAFTGGLCPTLQSGNVGVIVPNASCTINTATPTLETLTWAPCNMATPLGTWSGGSNFSLVATPSNTVMACTGFPAFQAGDVVTRSFFSPTGRINNAAYDPAYLPNAIIPYNPLTGQDLQPPFSSGPVTVLIDTFAATQIPYTTNYNNYNGGIPPGLPSAALSGVVYPVPTLGETIAFTSPVARNITINGIHVKADVAGYIVWDFTISTYNASGTGTPLSVNGATVAAGGIIYVQNNLTGVVTQSKVTVALAYTSGCGVPTSGTLQTTAVTGSFTTENLIFPGPLCGTGSINGGNNFYLFHSF